MIRIIALFIILFLSSSFTWAQSTNSEIEGAELGPEAIFDDRALINGYTDKFANETQDVLLAMINDDSIGSYKCAAAVRVFKQKYGGEILSTQKALIIKMLLRRLNRTDSPFVQVEIFHTLIVLDRYQYFEPMMPVLIQKLDHYNTVVRDLSYDNIQEIIKEDDRPREARIVFNILRKMFFLTRNRLNEVDEPQGALKEKLSILRWSIKILGTQELKKLPSEVIRLL